MMRDGVPGVFSDDIEQQISCPFHGQDNSPSMRVYPETNSCYCFKCKEAWDPVSYTIRKRGITFWEAIELLASTQGVNLDSVPKRVGQKKEEVVEVKPKAHNPKAYTKEQLLSHFTKKVLAVRGVASSKDYGILVYLLQRLKAERNGQKIKEVVALLQKKLS